VKGLSSAGDTTPRLNQAITLINTGFATVRGNRVRYVNEGILLDGKDRVFNNRVAIGIAGPALSLLSRGSRTCMTT
jgi:nitrous oxidase accessory protein NosD